MSKKIIIHKNKLYKLYIIDNLSIKEVSNIFNVSTSKIKRTLKEYSINKSIKKVTECTERLSLEKYGVKNPSQRKSVREKRKKTNIEKYGVDNPAKLNKFINKMKETNIKKYNHCCSLHNKEIKEKVKSTFQEKYGVDNALASKEIYNKTQKSLKESNFKRLLANLKNYVIPLFSIDDYEKQDWRIKKKWKCVVCGTEFEHYFYCNIPRCPKCYPKIYGSSNIEKEIQEYIKYPHENNKRFNKNGKYKYELYIYIPDKQLGIELDGLYWHSELTGNKDRYYHINKNLFFKERGITVLRFWDSEWLLKKDIVKSMINNKLGYSKKIYGRKCIIKKASSKDSRNFLNNNHLQGEINASIRLGLYHNNKLVSLLCIGKSKINKDYEYDIYRFCSLINYNVIGSFSKLLKYFIINYKPKNIITYADRRISEGNVYIKNGFELLKELPPNYHYTYKYTNIENRQNYQKHKLKENKYYNDNLTEWEIMQLNGYDRVWDCGNLVFGLNNP
jgi:very-short-patch-repair endonuclease